jgi:hypothetical protein
LQLSYNSAFAPLGIYAREMKMQVVENLVHKCL